MTTVAQIAAMTGPDHAWLFVIAGVPFAFTTSYEIAGSGEGSWIGTAYGPRAVYEGLELPRTIAFSTQLEDGRPGTDDGIEITVTDFSRQVIAFMRDRRDDVEANIGAYGPGLDPMSGALWGKWINGEAIGPAGERAYYPIFPGGDLPSEHVFTKGGAKNYIYDSPTMLEGLRCALYVLWRDPVSGTFANWEDHFDSGESLKWVGSLTNKGEVDSTVWKISADGPSSFLRKQLGSMRPERWETFSNKAFLDTTEGSRQDLFALSFGYRGSAEPVLERGASSNFDEILDVLPSAGSAHVFADAIINRIAVVSAEAGPDVTWTTERNAEAKLTYFGDRYTANTRMIDENVGDLWAFAAYWTLTLHRRVWNSLGFDPEIQNAVSYANEYEIKFVAANEVPGLDEPGPGYWQATFWTVPVGFASPFDATSSADNDGEWRLYSAINPIDPIQLSPDGGEKLVLGKFIQEENDSTGKYETNRPTGEYYFDDIIPEVGDADAQGYIAIRGSYLAPVVSVFGESSPGEVQSRVVLAQVMWKSWGVTGISKDIDEGRSIVAVKQYIDPKFYGCEAVPFVLTWTSNDLEYSWVNLLGYNIGEGTDLAHGVLLNLMLSSGTASWTGVEGSATLNNGINAHPSMPGYMSVYNDTNTYDLGLQIPHELIHVGSFTATAKDLPGGLDGDLARCRYAWLGETDSQDLVASILEPRGWGLGFNRGLWRLFSRPGLLTDDDVEVTIGLNDISSMDDAFREKVNRRPLLPRERFVVANDTALVSDAAPEKDLSLTVRATDPSYRTRRDNGEATFSGWGLVPFKLFGNLNQNMFQYDWSYDFTQLCNTLSQWYNTPHVMLQALPVRRTKARLLGPGTVVRVTTPYAPNQEGTYGLTDKLGRVYRVELDTEDLSAKVDILVQAGTSTQIRRFAPIAVVKPMVDTVEERHDVAARTFYVETNAFETGDDELHDCLYFKSPAYLSVGGDAVVHGYQFDGREWSQAFSFTVESVSTAADSVTYKPGTFIGTFKEAQYTLLVLAPYDDQPADSWPRALFSVLTRSDNKFGAVPTQGFKLVK